MSDILIRGMEKPGGCADCDFGEIYDKSFELLYYCKRTKQFIDEEEACNIPFDCPLVELPEHGDLIDVSNAENATFSLDDDFPNDYRIGWNDGIRAIIKNAPVIVPSNKEDVK